MKTEPSKKVKTEVSEHERDWKHTYKGVSKPCPSIGLMASNCRKYK